MKRKQMIGVLVVVATATLAGGVYYTWLLTPPPIPSTMDEAMALMDSARYDRLSNEEKAPYIRAGRELYDQADEDQQKQWREAFRERMRAMTVQQRMEQGEQWMLDRASAWAHAPAEERMAMIDKMIDMQEMAGAWRGRGGERPRQEGDRPEPTQEQRAEREKQRAEERAERERFRENSVEEGNPQKQAYVGEFFKAMQQRRSERGLPAGGGFGVRGGGR